MCHYITRRIKRNYLCLVLLCTLIGCTSNDPNISENIYTETEIDSENVAVVSETTENTVLDLHLTIPEHWKDIAVVTGYSDNWDTAQTGSAVAFTLYEKFSYLENSTGLVWAIQVYPLETELAYEVENVETVNGRLVLGTDDAYRYLLYQPTDVQYLWENEESTANYAQLQEESRAVIKGFLEENFITSNELLRDLFTDHTALGTQKITEVTDSLLETLIENVKNMQPVMRWFVYGCDVIDFEQDIQYSKEDGTYYYKINDQAFSEAGIRSMDSLKKYLSQYFTADYTETIVEKYAGMLMEVDCDLYILAASAAPSFLYQSPEFAAEYLSEDTIRLKCYTKKQLFDNEPEPVVLEFEFVQNDGGWLCSVSPSFSTWVRTDLSGH